MFSVYSNVFDSLYSRTFTNFYTWLCFAGLFPRLSPDVAGDASIMGASSNTPYRPPETMRVQCGRCYTNVDVTVPVAYGSFHVTCPTCRIRNKVDVPLPPPQFIPPNTTPYPPIQYNTPEATCKTNTIRLPVKRALLVGINYIGNRAQLKGIFVWKNKMRISYLSQFTPSCYPYSIPLTSYISFNTARIGCINDIRNSYRLLTESFGWESDCIKCLSDDLRDPEYRPTRCGKIVCVGTFDVKRLTRALNIAYSFVDCSSFASFPFIFDTIFHNSVRIGIHISSSRLLHRANIILWMRWLAEDVRPGDVLFFHFSGHGAQKIDPHGYEEDGS